MATVWEDAKIQKTCSADGRKSCKCGYCNTSFSGHNATKAVAHLCRTKGQDIAPCKQYHFIPIKHRQSHQDLLDRKSPAKRKHKVMHETIDRSIDVLSTCISNILPWRCTRRFGKSAPLEIVRRPRRPHLVPRWRPHRLADPSLPVPL